MSNDYDLADEVLVPLVAGLLAEHHAAARAVWDGGPLPRLRSSAFADAPRAVQTATLVFLGSAWTFGMPGLTVLKDAALDVRGAADWGRIAADHVPFEELERRRGGPRARRCDRCHEWACPGHEGAE